MQIINCIYNLWSLLFNGPKEEEEIFNLFHLYNYYNYHTYTLITRYTRVSYIYCTNNIHTTVQVTFKLDNITDSFFIMPFVTKNAHIELCHAAQLNVAELPS